MANIENKIINQMKQSDKKIFKEELESKAQQKMLQKKLMDTASMLEGLEKDQKNNLESE